MSEGLDTKSYEGPEEARHHAKKDRKKWCKGKVGREHVTEVAVPPNMSGWNRGCRMFNWRVVGNPEPKSHWICLHADICTRCGKVINWLNRDSRDCPDFPGGSEA